MQTRTITVDYARPRGYDVGYRAENNFTELLLPVPAELENADSYRVYFESTVGEYLQTGLLTPVDGYVAVKITSDIVPEPGNMAAQLVAFKAGEIVGYAPMITGSAKVSIPDGTERLSHSLAAEIALNTAARHSHDNKAVLDKFAETDGKPTYGGEALGGGGASTAENVSYTNTQLPNVKNVETALDELVPKSHSHDNKDTLDKLSVSNGKLQYNGSDAGLKGDKGDTGATGAQGLKGDTGAPGKDGKDGTDGITPTIGANGNWYIGSTDTGKPSRGEKGDKGDTPVKSENVVMNAWYNGYADPATMIKDGYQLISIPDGLVYIVPKAGYYYDYLNEPYLYKEWTPAHIGKAVFDEKHPSILGGMFAIWNDHVGNGISVKDIHHRIFSPLQTLSVKMWTGAQTGIPYETFNEKRALLSEAPGVNQLARIGKKPELVYERSTVAPGSTSDYPEIGYNYTVSFDITGAKESEGTELFRSPNAVFYLSDPIRGMMGFARDGYLNTFPYKVNPGEKATIQIEGNNCSTTLRVNGKVVDEMNTQKLYFNAGKDSMNYVRTLVFPLEKAGNFNSKVQNLKVYNYCVSKP